MQDVLSRNENYDFLTGMRTFPVVRGMVGVLVTVRLCAMEPQAEQRFLNDMEKDTRKFTAPAHGLFFEKAFSDQQGLDGFLDELIALWAEEHRDVFSRVARWQGDAFHPITTGSRKKEPLP